jgi:cytochrome c-type biogenesis protein CcmE
MEHENNTAQENTGAVTTSTRLPQTRKWRFLIVAAVVVAVLAYLILSSTQGSAVYALTIQELKGHGSAIYGRGVRVGGTVDGNSIVYDANQVLLKFELVDGQDTLPVIYKGARPDMFRDGAQALVEGKYRPSGTFEATKLLLKCPSKYEAAATQTATQ